MTYLSTQFFSHDQGLTNALRQMISEKSYRIRLFYLIRNTSDTNFKTFKIRILFCKLSAKIERKSSSLDAHARLLL